MAEENLGVFDARHIILEEHNRIEPCTLFFTSNRVIVVSPEGINRWAVATVIIAFAVSFTGLVLRNVMLFLGGFGAGITAGILIAILDFLIRHRRLKKMRKLNPERILEMNEENFEIRYAEIVKVKIRTFETYPRGNLFFPSFRERQHVIDFITNEKRYTFILDRSKIEQCLNLLHQFTPETIEIEQV